MRRLVIALAIGSVVACSGGSGPTAPTAQAPPPTNADLTGSYNATITASSSCSANLPTETRVLNYVADVTQHSGIFQVQLLAHVIWNTVNVGGTVSGQTINFSSFSFSEITTANGIALAGTGSANVAANGSIAGTLIGTYQTPSGAICSASNHQLQMVRR